MKRSVAVYLSAAVFVSLATSASGALVIDQEQPEFGGGWTYLGSETICGQSFQPGHDNVAGAGISLRTLFGTQSGDVTIELWDTLPTSTTGTLLRSVTINSVSVTKDPTWLDVSWERWDVPVGTTTLSLGFRSNNYDIAVLYVNNNPYAYGEAYSWTGSVWEATSTTDFTFRTYYDPAHVPVPGAVLLGTIGLGTAGHLTRRRVA